MSVHSETQSEKRLRGLKVCQVVATTEGGTWMFEQLRGLRDRYGCDVAAVVSGHEGKLIDKLDSESIPHFAFNFFSFSLRSLVKMPFELLRMARFFRRQRFDVVQTHVFISMVTGRLAAWLAGVPIRLSMIAGPFHLEAHTSLWIDRSTQWMETMLLPACEESARLCRSMGVTDDRLCLVYYGTNESSFDPRQTPPANIRRQFGWPEDTPVIGQVAYFYARMSTGRWVPAYVQGRGVKGHDDLIKAAAIIRTEFPDAKVLMIGSGWGPAGDTYLEEMKELVRSLGLEDTVLFAGFHPDVNGVLVDLDVAVQASINENFGGTIEALLMECPLVVTRVGGMVDVVRDGQTGILVEPSSPEDLARGILEMLRNPERARTLAKAGRELALERFTLRSTVDTLAGLYQGLAEKQRAKRRPNNFFVFVWRCLVAIPILAYVAFRLFVIDLFFPVYLPSYAARIRCFVYTAIYRLAYLPIRIYHRILNSMPDRLAAKLRRVVRLTLREKA